MKATGIVRNVDMLGRVVIPSELRRLYGIDTDTAMEFYSDEDGIVLRKYQPGCVICGEANDNIVVSGLRFCRRCAGKIAQTYSKEACGKVPTDHDGKEG